MLFFSHIYDVSIYKKNINWLNNQAFACIVCELQNVCASCYLMYFTIISNQRFLQHSLHCSLYISAGGQAFRANRPVTKPWYQIDLQEHIEVHAIRTYRFSSMYITYRLIIPMLGHHQCSDTSWIWLY